MGKKSKSKKTAKTGLVAARASAYDGAGNGRRSKSHAVSSLGPAAVLTNSLETLRSRSHAAVRNDAYAESIVTKLVTNIVGTGIRPQSKADSADFQKAAVALWNEWVIEADSAELLDFYGLQTQAVRTMIEGGECFVRLRPRKPEDGLSVPLQLQVLEGEHVPVSYNATNGGNRIVAGIEFNPIGKRVAYWMYRSHPGDAVFDFNGITLARVPAENVLHLFEPLRPGQIRGQPRLSQVLLRLHGLMKFDDAVLQRQEIANLFTAFIRQPPMDVTDDDVDPVTGKLLSSLRTDNDGIMEISLEPGVVQALDSGEQMEFSDPPDAGSNYSDFMRQQLMAAANAAGLSYEIATGDWSKMSDRTARVVLNDFRRRIEQLQNNIVVHQFCRPIYKRWMTLAVMAGELSAPDFWANPRAYTRVRWVPQGFAYIHPVQEIQADKMAVRNGFVSQSEIIVKRGGDPEQVYQQIADDNQRLEDLGIMLDSNPSQTDRSGDSQPTTDSKGKNNAK